MGSSDQKQHFDNLATWYEAHYFDRWSMAYRNEFIYPALWGGLDLNGKRVAELACGPGYNSLRLREQFPDAQLEGFDIANKFCTLYAEQVGAPAHEVDLTKPLADKFEPFDAAFVVGGLHHCIADLPCTLRNVAALLKPGGFFMMMEPNNRHFLEGLRRFWYRHDKFFDHANEAALDHDALLALSGGSFTPQKVVYFGGPAYFAILNSMILRIPLSAKPIIAPPLMAIERVWNRLRSPRWHNVFAAQWVRR